MAVTGTGGAGAGGQTAALQQQIQSTLDRITALGGNAQTALTQANAAAGGGGAATTTGGATTTTGGTNTQGLLTVDAQPTTQTYVASSGRTVTVQKDATGKYSLLTPTGSVESVVINGSSMRFDAKGKQVTNFDVATSTPFSINLDRKDGLASGLSNLSKIFGARQQRVQMMSEALAQDANETGSFDQVALQRMTMETQTTTQLSELQRKLFDSMNQAISAWLR